MSKSKSQNVNDTHYIWIYIFRLNAWLHRVMIKKYASNWLLQLYTYLYYVYILYIYIHMCIKHTPLAGNYLVISDITSWQQQQIHTTRTTPHQPRHTLLAEQLSWSIVLSKHTTIGLFGVSAQCCRLWCFFQFCSYYNWQSCVWRICRYSSKCFSIHFSKFVNVIANA